MRVAIYARVSTKEQQVETQLVCLRLYCEARGYEVTKEYVDAGISGFKPEDKRPALSELMNEARKQRIHAVIVWRFDRFARSSKHLIEALSEFQSLGIQFISYQENIDTSTPMGQAMFSIIAAMAQLERDIIRERVKAGMRHAKENGARFGAKPRFDRLELARLVPKMGTTQLAKHFGVSRQAILCAKNQLAN